MVLSHPTWVCGLKPVKRFLMILLLVTPYVGVWIETYGLRNAIDYGTVTPYVGVWIETFMSLSSSGVGMSHPTWVCGLKLSGTIRT